ncbi:MAG: permease-like cell division protein FtsX [Clostridium sp.]
MRISTLAFCIKEGIKNISRNVWFSLASTAIISACIFLFCMFFALVGNVQYMVKSAETTVGITVFFNEDVSEDEIKNIGNDISNRSEVKEVNYISAEQAWDTFKKDYFKDVEDLAEGFSDDNPLAGSSSYEFFLKDISSQGDMVSYLKTIPGIRKINYSNDTAAGLSNFNKMLGLVSVVIIGILLAVATFLISNTISTAAAFRKDENRIMRFIGATNFMIRAPFVVEGIIIGFVGAALPLAAIYVLYRDMVQYMMEKFNILSNIIEFIPINSIFPYMVVVAMALGVGIGFVGSFFTIRKHLKV